MTDERCPTCKSDHLAFMPGGYSADFEYWTPCPDSFHSPVATTYPQTSNDLLLHGYTKPAKRLGTAMDYNEGDKEPLLKPVADSVTKAELKEQDWGANDDLRQRLVADGGEGRDPACSDPDCSYRSEIQTGYYVPASDLAEAEAERDVLRTGLEHEIKRAERAEAELTALRERVDELEYALRRIAGGDNGHDLAPIFGRLRGIADAALNPDTQGENDG